MTSPYVDRKQRSEADELRIIRRLIVAALAAVVIIGVVFYASTTSQTHDIVKARTEARYAQCLHDNQQADRAVDYARDQALVLIASAHANPKDATPAAYVVNAENAARRLFPKRSCTKAAIDAYYRTGR